MFGASAHVYDLVYGLSGKDYAAESAALTDQIRSRSPQARTLLDVACGTGGHLVHLRESFDVAGVDLDQAMLRQARERLPGVELDQADMRHFDLATTFDAVICLFSSVGYMPDRSGLIEAVGRMADHLSPGGVLVVDGWVRPDEWIDPGTVDVVSGRKGGQAIARLIRSERIGDRTVLHLHHLVGTTDSVEHIVERHELTLFSNDDYRAAFAAAGLEVELVDGPMPGRDRYVAIKSD